MTRFISIAAIAATCFAVATPALAQRAPANPAWSQVSPEEARFNTAQQRLASEFALYQAEYDRYQASRASRASYDDRRNNDRRGYEDDRNEGNYNPATYYRSSSRYRERTLNADERVYRGQDGRYYCKRNDGTTGLIVGAVAGGVLGNVIDGGHSRVVGMMIGGAAGAVAGQAIDRNMNNNEIRCR